MENKQNDGQFEKKIKEMLMQKAPEPEIVDQKMQAAYRKIRETGAARKKKLPFGLRFGTVAAVIAIALVYCVKNPAVAAQIPLIGNIFREMEGESLYPGDYSKKSIQLEGASVGKDSEAAGKTDGKEKNETSDLQSDQAQNETSDLQSDQAQNETSDLQNDQAQNKPSDSKDDKISDTGSYRKKIGDVTVTLSEAAYDHDAIFLGILVQHDKGFVKDALYPDNLSYDAKIKLLKADGSSKNYSYKSEGIFNVGIQGEYVDNHTFRGIFQFQEEGVDLTEYVACELKFGKFQQLLKTGKEETVIVPDYGEVKQTIPDRVCYDGPWKFRLDLDGITIHEEEVAVQKTNDKGFGIEKVVKTEFEIYAVPKLPDGENLYDYVATIWDADGKPLENRNFGKYLTMSHYGRDVSKVTVYLLKTLDFLDNKGNNAYLQPKKAIYKTTVRFED